MPIKARKEIIVYKIVLVDGKEYCTPYRYVPIRLHQTLNAVGKLMPTRAYDYVLGKIGVIEDGYIHCLTSQEGAFVFAHTFLRGLLSYRITILECIIPPGTLYYKSVSGNEICARSIYAQKVALVL